MRAVTLFHIWYQYFYLFIFFCIVSIKGTFTYSVLIVACLIETSMLARLSLKHVNVLWVLHVASIDLPKRLSSVGRSLSLRRAGDRNSVIINCNASQRMCGDINIATVLMWWSLTLLSAYLGILGI